MRILYHGARLDSYVYHLDHARTVNSWFSNPKFNSNYQLWDRIRSFDKIELMDYYNKQDYLKTRRRLFKNP